VGKRSGSKFLNEQKRATIQSKRVSWKVPGEYIGTIGNFLGAGKCCIVLTLLNFMLGDGCERSVCSAQL
jgi:hypothetical protein